MKAGDAIAEILKREGIEIVIGYPVNHVLEYAAAAGIRPIIVRQERTGLHMADAISRLRVGDENGGWRVQGIDLRSVIVEKGAESVRLGLPKPDGSPSE